MQYLNTSHVLIYLVRLAKEVAQNTNLNTSHVLIYPYKSPIIPKEQIFKYISCSYLSIAPALLVECCFVFKYISCSYLSCT